MAFQACDECKLSLQIAANGGVNAADEMFKVSICRTHVLAGMLEGRFRRAEMSLRVWNLRVYMSCKMCNMALSPLDAGVIYTASCLLLTLRLCRDIRRLGEVSSLEQVLLSLSLASSLGSGLETLILQHYYRLL